MAHTFSNGIQVNEKGEIITKVAQVSQKEVMPKDTIEEQNRVEEGETRLDIPRDESVGLKQTEPKEVTVYKYKYELGDNGCDTDMVPRDSSGDGLGGAKVTFEPELADGYDSGNSDNYVQTLQDREKPTPAGDSKNHAVVAMKELELKLAEKEREVLEAKREAQAAKIRLEREKYASKIVQAEIERGLYTFASEQDVDARIATIAEDMPVKYLARELERVKQYPTLNQQASVDSEVQPIAVKANRVQNGFEAFGGLQSGSWSVPRVYDADTPVNVTPTTIRSEAMVDKLKDTFKLGQQYSDSSIKDYQNYRKSK